MTNKNVPKLRFKMYDDEWSIKKIGDLFDNSSSNLSIDNLKDNYGDYKLYGATGLIKHIDFYEKDKTYIAIIKDGASVGKTFICDSNSSILGTLQYLEPKESFDFEFCYYLLNRVHFEKYKVGSTIPHIYFKDYSMEKISIPKKEEQAKIASFLYNIDKKIGLLKDKKDEYVKFKQYLLQNLFPQDGKIAPKLRFNKYNDEWNPCNLKDVGTFYSGVGFKNEYQGFLNLPIKMFKVSDMNIDGNEKYMHYSNNTIDMEICESMKSKPIQKPSIIFAKVGAAIFLDRKRITFSNFLIDNNMMSLTPNSKVDLEFLYYLVNTINFGKYAKVGALPSYNSSDIGSIKCKIPSILEQKEIASVLISIDNKLELLYKQIQLIEEYKNGLLQKMFI